MNDIIFNTLKGKDFIVKNYIFKVALELKLSLQDTILLIYFMNQDEPSLNIERISSTTYLTEEEIMESFSKLIGINLVSMKVIKENDGTRKEIIDLDNIIKSVTMDIAKKDKAAKDTNLFEIFEREFGRSLSPMEYELINNWLDEGTDPTLIEEALKESIFNGVKSLRYISKILLSWKDKGYKKATDVKSNLKKETEETSVTSIFDYNWLDDEETNN